MKRLGEVKSTIFYLIVTANEQIKHVWIVDAEISRQIDGTRVCPGQIVNIARMPFGNKAFGFGRTFVLVIKARGKSKIRSLLEINMKFWRKTAVSSFGRVDGHCCSQNGMVLKSRPSLRLQKRFPSSPVQLVIREEVTVQQRIVPNERKRYREVSIWVCARLRPCHQRVVCIG